MLRAISVVMAVSVAFFCSSVQAASQPKRIRNDKYHFSFEVPDGWHPIKQEAVENLDRVLAERTPNKAFTYLFAYGRSDTGEMTYPYVLFQMTETPLGNASVSDLQRTFGADTFDADMKKAIDPISDIVANCQATPQLDIERKRVIIPMSMDVAGIGPARGLCVGLLGKHGIVQINCCALEADFDAIKPAFLQWIDTFKLDAEYEWVPGTGGIDWTQVGKSGMWGAIIGGLAGVLMVLFKIFKKKPAAAPQERNVRARRRRP